MITILLYGELGKLYNKTHNYAVRTVPEAVRALEANYNGFRTAINNNGAYRIVVDKAPIDENEISKVAVKTIKIIPLVQGAGKVGKIIIGAALLAFSFYNPLNWLTAKGTLGAFGLAAAQSIGFSLVLGGVSEMLMKTKKQKSGADRPDNIPSYSFDGPVNTTAQGNPAPLAYGRILAGSQVISAGLEAV